MSKPKKKRAKRSSTSSSRSVHPRHLEAVREAGARRGRAGGPWLPEHFRLDVYEQGVEVHKLGAKDYQTLQAAHHGGHGLAQRASSSAGKAPRKAAKKAPRKAAKKAPRKAAKKQLTGAAFARRMAAARAAKKGKR